MIDISCPPINTMIDISCPPINAMIDISCPPLNARYLVPTYELSTAPQQVKPYTTFAMHTLWYILSQGEFQYQTSIFLKIS